MSGYDAGIEAINSAFAALFFALAVVALVALAHGCGPDVETLVRSFR